MGSLATLDARWNVLNLSSKYRIINTVKQSGFISHITYTYGLVTLFLSLYRDGRITSTYHRVDVRIQVFGLARTSSSFRQNSHTE